MYVTGIILCMKGTSEEYHPEAITEREEWKESTLQKADIRDTEIPFRL